VTARDSSDHLPGNAATGKGLQSQAHSLLEQALRLDDLGAGVAEVEFEDTAGSDSEEQERMNASLGAAAGQGETRAHPDNAKTVARQGPRQCSVQHGQTTGQAQARIDGKRDAGSTVRGGSIGSEVGGVVERTREVLVVE